MEERTITVQHDRLGRHVRGFVREETWAERRYRVPWLPSAPDRAGRTSRPERRRHRYQGQPLHTRRRAWPARPTLSSDDFFMMKR